MAPIATPLAVSTSPRSGLRTRAVAGVVRSAAFARAMALLDSLDRTRAPVLPVLMYHRIGFEERTPELDPSLLSATPAEFARQVKHLASERRVLSLDDLLEVRRGRMALPPRSVVVTFDDGYRDFQEHAWPALRRHGVPATLFVPTAYPGDPQRTFWWDRLHAAFATTARRAPLSTAAGTLALRSADERRLAARTLRDWVKRTTHDEAMAEVDHVTAALSGRLPLRCVLTWAELRELARDGLDLAPHTRTHPMIDQVTLEQAEQEILGSVSDLHP